MTEPAPAPPSALDPDPLYRAVRDARLHDDVPTQVEDLTDEDWQVTRTDNGLRPDDLALEQPPQDPAWSPRADG